MSAVSRQVAQLEAHLDARLLNRTTRRLSLTESGRAFHERCVQLLADLEEAEQSANAGTVTPRGTLRLTASITFGARHLAPAIAEFIARYPEMRFDVELSDRATDLVEEGFDVAVRIGDIGSQNLVGRKVGTRGSSAARRRRISRVTASRSVPRTSRRTCASPTNTRRSATSGRFATAQGRERNVRIAGPLHANNGRFLEALAVEGMGICYEPDFIVGPDVRGGRLKPLLQRLCAAAEQHLRRVPEPPPPVGQGPRVRRFPGRAIRHRRLGAVPGERGCGSRLLDPGRIASRQLDLPAAAEIAARRPAG